MTFDHFVSVTGVITISASVQFGFGMHSIDMLVQVFFEQRLEITVAAIVMGHIFVSMDVVFVVFTSTTSFEGGTAIRTGILSSMSS